MRRSEHQTLGVDLSIDTKSGNPAQAVANASFSQGDFASVVLIKCHGKQGLVKTFASRGGMNLWAMIRKIGLPIGSACSGVGVCAACHVKVSPPQSVTEQSEFEASALTKNGKDPLEERLACLCRVRNNLEVYADYW